MRMSKRKKDTGSQNQKWCLFTRSIFYKMKVVNLTNKETGAGMWWLRPAQNCHEHRSRATSKSHEFQFDRLDCGRIAKNPIWIQSYDHILKWLVLLTLAWKIKIWVKYEQKNGIWATFDIQSECSLNYLNGDFFRWCCYEIKILLEQSSCLKILLATASWHIVLMGWFLLTISDVCNCLTDKMEKYVNESSYNWNSALLIYSYTLLIFWSTAQPSQLPDLSFVPSLWEILGWGVGQLTSTNRASFGIMVIRSCSRVAETSQNSFF